MKLLVVDDHAVVHHGLRSMLGLEFEGLTFAGATHSQEALDLVSQEDWDVVILDIELSGLGGLEVLRQIKLTRPKLPVIIFSMHSEEQFALRSLKAGASAYIAKDSDPGQLIQAVRNAIAGRRYVSPALGERLAAYHGQDLSPVPLDILSDREFEVLRMIAAGKTTTTIADELSLSVKTISTYRTRILAKLQLKSTPELMRFAIDQGLDR